MNQASETQHLGVLRRSVRTMQVLLFVIILVIFTRFFVTKMDVYDLIISIGFWLALLITMHVESERLYLM